MAAERFEWIMKTRDDDGPFGIVDDYVWKKEYQKCGAAHASVHILNCRSNRTK